jgi:hypothetical protein
MSIGRNNVAFKIYFAVLANLGIKILQCFVVLLVKSASDPPSLLVEIPS